MRIRTDPEPRAGPSSRHPLRRPGRAALQLALGVALSGVFVWLFLDRIDLSQAVEGFARLSVGAVAGAVSLVLVAVVGMAVRWHVLLAAAAEGVRVGRLLVPAAFGRGANNLLPARLGDLLRIESVREREGVGFAVLAGTLAVERVLDGLVLAGWIVLGALLLGSHGVLLAVGLVVLGGSVVVAVLAWLAVGRPDRIGRIVEVSARRLPRAWRAPLVRAALGFVSGLSIVRSTRRLGVALLATAAMWLSEVAVYAVVARSLEVGLEPGAYFLLHGIGNVALAVPSAAAGIGTYDFAVLSVAERLGASAPIAGTYVLALHALDVLPVTLLALLVAPRALPRVFAARSRRRRLAVPGDPDDADAPVAHDPGARSSPREEEEGS